MTKYFTSPADGRTIRVQIDKENDVVGFKYKNGLDFYDISLHEWKDLYPYWQDHMKMKNWFTQEIETFINQNS